MKFKITIDVPDDIGRGLEAHAVHPGLAPAEVTERQRAQDLEAVRAELQAAQGRAEALAADVQTGRASVRDLDAALRTRDALALRIVPAETALVEATKSRERGQAHAADALRAEAKRRNDELQKLADQVAPVLRALLQAEMALEAATRAALGGSVTAETGLPAVLWPSCLRPELAEAIEAA